MKTNTLFKRAFNDALDLVSGLVDVQPLPSEHSLSAELGVSRTTVRKILSVLMQHGVVSGSGSDRIVHPNRHGATRFPEAETVAMSAQVEKRFME